MREVAGGDVVDFTSERSMRAKAGHCTRIMREVAGGDAVDFTSERITPVKPGLHAQIERRPSGWHTGGSKRARILVSCTTSWHRFSVHFSDFGPTRPRKGETNRGYKRAAIVY